MEDNKLDLNGRNALLGMLAPMIFNDPAISAGDIVSANDIGLKTGVFEAGERFAVVRVGEMIAKFAGDPTRTVELWSITEDGEVRRTLTDPKFLMVVEAKTVAAPVKPAARSHHKKK